MTPFQQAFADARAAGKKEFEFGGKPYHTRLKGEKASGGSTASKAPPSRTVKATVSQTVRPETPTSNRRSVADIAAVAKRGLAKAAGAIPTKTASVKTTTSSPATGKTTTTMAALKANKKDFSRAGVEARKLATMTGSKVARKK